MPVLLILVGNNYLLSLPPYGMLLVAATFLTAPFWTGDGMMTFSWSWRFLRVG